MIIWLASYPRSGNSLIRLMLMRVWGIKTFSMYGDGGDIANVDIARRIGHVSFGKPFSEIHAQLTESPEVHLVKTHEIPIDSQKAIYIVRDGRSASRSFCRYRLDFNNCTDESKTLRDIILGFNSFGSWSNHLDTWNPLERPGTLLLKYEDLLERPESQFDRISDFLELKPVSQWHNNFDELAQLEPRYFRAAAANRPDDAIGGSHLELFWMLHAPWMRRLGYLPSDAALAVPELSDSFRSSLYHAVSDQIGHIASLSGRTQKLENELRRQTPVVPRLKVIRAARNLWQSYRGKGQPASQAL